MPDRLPPARLPRALLPPARLSPARLSPARLSQLPAGVARPTYDRTTLPVGVAHLGVGAFHRCHQAEYLDDLLQAGAAAAGMVGINLYPPALTAQLGPQGGLYSRTLTDDADHETRVIGAILRVIDAPAQITAALAALADPQVTTVTLTVTEKGYCHIPATGALDHSHPGVIADLAGGAMPQTIPGLLARALAARAAAGAGPGAGSVNLISCDNIPANGAILARVVRAMALPALQGWIDDNVAFPATMVDRIVPATTPAARDALALALGCRDEGAVFGEPFRQWVITDDFRAPRPAWEQAGAQIATDVEPYEHIKMRLLNAAQTMTALLGALAGHQFTHQAIRDPAIRGAVTRALRSETIPHLPSVPGMEPAAYLARSLSRIENRAIHHECRQIATDTSQKIRQRLLEPIRARRAAGLAHDGLTGGVAAWIAWLACSGPAFAARWPVSDPVAGRVAGVLARRGRDLRGIAADVLGFADVFGDDLARDDGFAARVAVRAERLIG